VGSWSRGVACVVVAGVVAMMGVLPAVASSGASTVATEEPAASLYQSSRAKAQKFTVPADAARDRLVREGYSATTLAEVTAAQDARARQWPLSGTFVIGEGLGARGGAHMGVDFAAADGHPVHVAASGTVRLSQESYDGYGVTVIIDHDTPHPTGERVSTLYAHLSSGSRFYEVGTRVNAGDILGLVGNTGRSYGSHLHFEVHTNDTPIDPLAWLPDQR
jgi:murein DD-endopeptidase MepM/ murein hydrolase activator NlpD